MKCSFAAIAVLLCVPAAAGANSVERALRALDPEERANQVCAIKGVETLRKDKILPKVDRIKTGTSGRAAYDGLTVTSKTGAVRSVHDWYLISFSCGVTADQMKATSFTYQIGAKIPEDTWEQYGLWR